MTLLQTCGLSVAFTLAAFAQVTAPVALPTQTGAGSIAGRAVAPDGRGLRAMVALQLLGGSPAAANSPAIFHVATDRNGAFQFQQLPPGKYSLCAQPVAGQGRTTAELFVDSCEWGQTQSPLVLTAAQTIGGLTLTVLPGALVTVHLSDPGGLLAPSASKPGIGGQIQVFLKTPDRLVHYLPVTAHTSTARDHTALIPYGVSMSLVVQSSQVRVIGGNGAALTAAIPVLAAAGSALAPISLTIQRGQP